MLVLDGVIQLTEFDHFAYHEMITHVPMNAHPNPRSVLIIGGGDGGALTEALKYDHLESIVLCEIDQAVIDISRKHFPEFDRAYNDKRVTIIVDDAAEFIKQTTDHFDVIIVDSSDPIGPAEVLYQDAFYKDVFRVLTEDGIVVSQAESMFYHADFIGKLLQQNKIIFPITHYYYALVPTYPSGTIGFLFCSKKYEPNHQPSHRKDAFLNELRYYSEGIHRSAFVLPAFFNKILA
jgi:spermidine synthase